MAERSTRILLVDDEQSIQTLLSYPLRKDGYEVVQATDGRRGARPLRRAAVRPRRARRDAAEARRARGLPAPAQPQRGADHHADREVGGDRQGRRARDRRRRLHHQAVLDARVPQPREGGAAALGDARAPPSADGRHARAPRAADRSRQAHRVAARRERSRRRSSSSRSCSRSRAAPAASSRATCCWRASGATRAYRDPRTIDVHIRHLREKLERDPKEPEYLFTVRGVGYRFRDTDDELSSARRTRRHALAAQPARVALLRDHARGDRGPLPLRRAAAAVAPARREALAADRGGEADDRAARRRRSGRACPCPTCGRRSGAVERRGERARDAAARRPRRRRAADRRRSPTRATPTIQRAEPPGRRGRRAHGAHRERLRGPADGPVAEVALPLRHRGQRRRGRRLLDADDRRRAQRRDHPPRRS